MLKREEVSRAAADQIFFSERLEMLKRQEQRELEYHNLRMKVESSKIQAPFLTRDFAEDMDRFN